VQQIKEEEKSAHGFYYRNSIRANTLIFRALVRFCLFNTNFLILLKYLFCWSDYAGTHGGTDFDSGLGSIMHPASMAATPRLIGTGHSCPL
jgi:hypothetical protein